MTDERPMSIGRIITVVAIFALVGMPIVAFLWETLNQLLALHVQWWRIGVAIPLAFVLYFWLTFLARTLRRLEGPRLDAPTPFPDRR